MIARAVPALWKVLLCALRILLVLISGLGLRSLVTLVNFIVFDFLSFGQQLGKSTQRVKIGNMEENAMHYADMCEIRFSGLPDFPDVRDIDRVAAVLKVLECDERILLVRRWMPSRSSNTPSTSADATLNFSFMLIKPRAEKPLFFTKMIFLERCDINSCKGTICIDIENVRKETCSCCGADTRNRSKYMRYELASSDGCRNVRTTKTGRGMYGTVQKTSKWQKCLHNSGLTGAMPRGGFHMCVCDINSCKGTICIDIENVRKETCSCCGADTRNRSKYGGSKNHFFLRSICNSNRTGRGMYGTVQKTSKWQKCLHNSGLTGAMPRGGF
ncbi:unnamed protein product, partial [Trichogramma brassicae]